MEILLGREDVNPNIPDSNGQTPLCCAALNGHEVVVQLLLSRGDIDPDKPDKYGQTPLSCAARYGYVKVMALLQPPTAAIYSTA